MFKFLIMAAAGGLGAMARYGLGGFVHRFVTQAFPWGTVVVNVTGCFLFGLIWAYAETRLAITSEHKLIVLTGFMGSFTTFSTFIFESGMLIRDSQWLPAIGNIILQNGLGICALALGFIVAKSL